MKTLGSNNTSFVMYEVLKSLIRLDENKIEIASSFCFFNFFCYVSTY